MDFTKSEAKAWAREAYIGLESLICPSKGARLKARVEG